MLTKKAAVPVVRRASSLATKGVLNVNRVYHLAYAGLDISFTVDGTRLTVTAVDDAQD